MAACAYCGSTLFVMRKRVGTLEFCSDAHVKAGHLIVLGQQVPDAEVEAFARELQSGRCPQCSGAGPVDAHTSHSIWSAIVLTRFASKRQVSCRRCAMKQQTLAIGSSLVLGWWGLPWGVIMTPVQVLRNVGAMVRDQRRPGPSPELRHEARLRLAARLARSRTAAQPAA